MNVVHIITGLNDGGAEGVLYRLCTNDKKCTHTVISLLDKGKYGPLLEEQGVRVYCLNMKRGKITLSALRALYRKLKEYQPDIVQTWMYHGDLIGGLVSRVAGIENVFWNIRHSTLEKGKSKKSTIHTAKILALLSRWVPKKIICCAESALEIHAGLGYKKDKMLVIGNGYELKRFKPSSTSRENIIKNLELNESIPILGMVARYNSQKNHKGLLKTLKILNDQGVDFQCLLIGRNIDSNNVSLVKKLKKFDLNNKVLLLGQRNDIPAIMNSLDVHMLSSSFGEAFPNVLAEAMACETPCVTTDVGDAAAIVGETGWVVPPRDYNCFSTALFSAINEMNEKPTAWEARKKACRERIAEQFSLNAMIKKYHEAWHLN